jgi:hypothetical protein
MVGLFCMDGSGLASIYSRYGLFSGLVLLHVVSGLSRYAYLFEVESEYCIEVLTTRSRQVSDPPISLYVCEYISSDIHIDGK